MSKYCSNCGSELRAEALFCDKCGAKISIPEQGQIEPAPTSSFSAPYSPVKKPKKRTGLIALLLIAVGLMVFTLVVMNLGNVNNTPEGKIMAVANISEDKAKVVNSKLSECGIDSLVSISHDEMLDDSETGEKGYRLATEDIKNIILYLSAEGGVNAIRWADKDFYKDGKVIGKITDYILRPNERSDLKIRCENAVKSVLKAPSTAKFPSILEWKFQKTPEKIVVQGYVDAQNSFGAMIRNEFQVTFTPDKSEIISFILDGTEYVNNDKK